METPNKYFFFIRFRCVWHKWDIFDKFIFLLKIFLFAIKTILFLHQVCQQARWEEMKNCSCSFHYKDTSPHIIIMYTHSGYKEEKKTHSHIFSSSSSHFFIFLIFNAKLWGSAPFAESIIFCTTFFLTRSFWVLLCIVLYFFYCK